MASVTIPDLPFIIGSLTGDEQMEAVRDGVSHRVTTGMVAALSGGDKIPIAPKSLKANLLDTSAPPESAKLTEILDSMMSSTKGVILYRGEEAWTPLPIGPITTVLTVSPNRVPVWSPGGGAGSGTVTNVSIDNRNGFTGTVSDPSTVPSITLSTSVSGILRGSGGSISEAPSDVLASVNTLSIRDGSGNLYANAFVPKLDNSSITLVFLTKDSSQVQNLAAATSVTLPKTTDLLQGRCFEIFNDSNNPLPVKISTGQALLYTIAPKQDARFYVIVDIVDTLSSWHVSAAGGIVTPSSVVPQPNTLVLRDANSNSFNNNSIESTVIISATGATTVLTVSSPKNTIFTGSSFQIVTLPVVTTLSPGMEYCVVNRTTANIPINSSGGTTVAIALPSSTMRLTLASNAPDATPAPWIVRNTASGAGKLNIGSLVPGFSHYALGGTLTLTYNSLQTQHIMTPTSITLPNTTGLYTGFYFDIINSSGQTVTISTAGAAVLVSLQNQRTARVMVTDIAVDRLESWNAYVSVQSLSTLSTQEGGTGLSTSAGLGELLVGSGGPLTLLPRGINGTVLTMQSGVPAWVAGGGGGGSVTNVTIQAINGFNGVVVNPSTTPSLQIETSINASVLAGDGKSLKAATVTGTGQSVVLATSPSISSPTLSDVVLNGTTTGSGVSITSTRSTLAMRNSHAGLAAEYFLPDVTSLIGSVILDADSSQLNIAFGSSSAVFLPSADTIEVGRHFDVFNRTSSVLSVSISTGPPVGFIPVGASAGFTLIDTTVATTASWFVDMGGPSGGGSVSTVSVKDANGFMGTVINPSTTPEITIKTGFDAVVVRSLNGILGSATTSGTGSLVVMAGGPIIDTPELKTPQITGIPTGTGVSVNADNNTLALRTPNGGMAARYFKPNYISIVGAITLDRDSAQLQVALAGTTSVHLPDVSTLDFGRRFEILNNSSAELTVTSSDNVVLYTIPRKEGAYFTFVSSPQTIDSWFTTKSGGFGTVTSVSFNNANGFTGTVGNFDRTPVITISTSLTGMIRAKTDGSLETIPSSGTGSVVFSDGPEIYAATMHNVKIVDVPRGGILVGSTLVNPMAVLPIGTTGQVLTVASNGTAAWQTGGGGGSGTVTSVSVASANGFTGTVATSTTTPVISIGTSLTGILKGDGTGMSVAASSPLSDAGSLALRTADGSLLATSFVPDMRTVTAAGVYTVTAGDSQILNITGASSIKLPAAIVEANGRVFDIFNNTSADLPITLSDGTTLLYTVTRQQNARVTVIDKTINTAAAWEVQARVSELDLDDTIALRTSTGHLKARSFIPRLAMALAGSGEYQILSGGAQTYYVSGYSSVRLPSAVGTEFGRVYEIYNATGSNLPVNLFTGTDITVYVIPIKQGIKLTVIDNTTDAINSWLIDVKLLSGSALFASQGGTGTVLNPAQGTLLYGSGSGVLGSLAIGAADNILSVASGISTPVWVASTGTGNVVRATSPIIDSAVLNTAVSGTAISSSSAALKLALRDISGNLLSNSFVPGVFNRNSAGVYTLTANDAQIQNITQASSVVLPSGGSLSYGRMFDIINCTSNALPVYGSDGTTLAYTIPPALVVAMGGQTIRFTMVDVTASGINGWRVSAMGGASTVMQPSQGGTGNSLDPSIGSLLTGDIMLGTVPVYSNLAVGTAGQVLTVSSTSRPVWATPSSSSINSTVRQTVLSGPITSTGMADFMPVSAASLNITTVNISSTTPLIVSAARGSASGGSVDSIGVTTSNLTWTGLPANSTVYLYVTISGGVLTPRFTTTDPVYDLNGTASAVSGAFTFFISPMAAYIGNGSTAVLTYAVLVGECVTTASGVFPIYAYSYNGYFESVAPGLASGQTNVINSRIGHIRTQTSLLYRNIIADAGYVVGDTVNSIITNAGAAYVPVPVHSTRVTTSFTTGAGANFYLLSKSNGALTAITPSRWVGTICVRRAW